MALTSLVMVSKALTSLNLKNLSNHKYLNYIKYLQFLCFNEPNQPNICRPVKVICKNIHIPRTLSHWYLIFFLGDYILGQHQEVHNCEAKEYKCKTRGMHLFYPKSPRCIIIFYCNNSCKGSRVNIYQLCISIDWRIGQGETDWVEKAFCLRL